MLQSNYYKHFLTPNLCCDNKPGGLSPKTLKSIKHMLNVAFDLALANELIAFNPVLLIRLPSVTYEEAKFLSSDEKERLLHYLVNINTTVSKGMILLFNLGIRRGELLGLRWKNINFQDEYIKIKHTLTRLKKFKINSNTQDYIRIDTYANPINKTAIYLGPVKTKKAKHNIYLPDSVKQALLILWDIQEKYRKKFDKEIFNPFGFIMCTKEGKPIDPRFLEENSKMYVHKATQKEINIHAARHTFTTEALYKSNDIITVSKILGHTLPSTTLNFYGHTIDKRKKKLMQQID